MQTLSFFRLCLRSRGYRIKKAGDDQDGTGKADILCGFKQ